MEKNCINEWEKVCLPILQGNRKDVADIRVPSHIGIIPDGNRRWAAARGLEKHEGYDAGLEPGVRLLRAARDAGVKEITYYGFTAENCKRPAKQLQAFSQACVDAVKLIAEQGVSLLVVGNAESPVFPDALRPFTTRRDIAGGGMRVNFLVNYGWEWDLSAAEGAAGKRSLMQTLRSREVSRVDLVIRWGGMRRLSGFLPVQSVYADFFVVDKLWPDFAEQDFYDALDWYNHQDVTLGG